MNHYLIRLKNILRSRYLFKILFIICLIYIFIYIKYDSIPNLEGNIFYGKIIDYKYTNDTYKITIKSNYKLLINYKTTNELNINYGDYIKVSGVISTPSNNTIPNLFNYKNYLRMYNINYIINANDIELISYNTNIFYDIKNNIVSRINKLNKSSSYIYSLILNNKSYIDKEIKTSYMNNGISYLFNTTIYLAIYIKLLNKLLNKVSYNNYYKFIITLIILLSYVLIINKSVSVLRYLIMFIINKVNKLFNLNIKRLDLMLIIFIIISLINPYYVIDISFILSYLIIFFIVVLNKKKNKLYISFLCFLVSFPLVISINYNINIISFIFNFILKIYNIFIILPISIISLFIPSIDNILYKLINLIETISLFLSNINILNISFSKPSIIFIIIYYILLILYMYDKKYIITILMIILIHKYFYLIDNTLSVTYLDVGQGDSIVITYKSNVILMDTGGNIYSDISNNKTIPYLKSLGKNKIDYLILSHGDYDHMGESINLVNNFKVDNVIFNKDNYNELEQELINVLENNNIKYYNSVNYIDINNIRLYFLNDKIYDNENDNSNIIYFSYYNYNFLFTGDISSNVEKYLVNNYNLNKIDFLKVSHHGSDTSSSKYFIDKLNVVNSIISVGRNNIYNHPSILTLNNLENTNIYRTDIEGSIKVDLNKNRYKIKTYSP